jgi:putative membrane-bound dehydrogenase-like protein
MPSLVVALAWGLFATSAELPEIPKSIDHRVAIGLVAAEPDLVTPTGIAVDSKGRVIVIESHTHFRPQGYKGPPGDRIRVFEVDAEGKPKRVSTFFEGTRFTMNLGIYTDDSLFVATRWEVFHLSDEDGDGKADRKRTLVKLETAGDYPHNGLSGFAFDYAGNVYFGLGENLGADYRLVGSDGTSLSGGGEGGNIYRCAPDGSNLERISTGFWNPFHLTFDAFGRLFAVDNDPDSRPPCRLLHIVEGGDYGYRFRNGRKGLHPFTAWNGELPGTLPMLAGTGEAPSGVVAYESDLLPEDYRGTLLVTSWGDHRIERYRPQPHGASLKATMEPVVQGGENFRPVGIAQAPDGSLYVSDWVDKSYPLHGKGRIWRIRNAKSRTGNAGPASLAANPTALKLDHPDRRVREAAARSLTRTEAGLRQLADAVQKSADPRARALALQTLVVADDAREGPVRAALQDASADVRALAVRLLPARLLEPRKIAVADPAPAVKAEALRRIADAEALDVLLAAVGSSDPFLAQAAREGLKQSLSIARLLDLTELDNPAQRLGILLVLRESSDPAARRTIPKFLEDSDPLIRFAAIQWVGDQKLTEFRKSLEAGLARGGLSRSLFEAHLAALERLAGRVKLPTDEIAGEDYVARLVVDSAADAAVRRRALRALRPNHPALSIGLLKKLVDSADPAMRLEAVRTLRDSPHQERTALLARLARDEREPNSLRAEAIVGLSPESAGNRAVLVALALDSEPALRHEALRSLRGAVLEPADRARLATLAQGDPESKALLAFVVDPASGAPYPSNSDLDAWVKLLRKPADADEGERIFFHPKGPGCFRCHQVDGRGGQVGPDLSITAPVLDPRRLVESIVQPSKEVAPQSVAWLIAKKDGTVASGVLVGETPEGNQMYANAQGNVFTVASDDVETRRPLPTSIMPDDLVKTLTPQEFRDLIAFLRGARSGSEPAAGPADRNTGR